MRRSLMVLAYLVLAGSLLGVPAAAAQPGGPAPALSFDVPERVLGGQFWYGIDMGVDADGHVHLVAAGIRSGKGGLWYATDRRGSWTWSRVLRWSAGTYWIRPVIAVTPAGRVHIAVEKSGCIECTVAPAKGIFHVTDAGRARGTFPAVPARLTGPGTAQPSLRVAGGHLFLAYAGQPDAPAAAVRLRTDASGRWTTSVVAERGSHPYLRIGMDGRPRVTWSTPTRIRYARATTLTGGWVREAVATPDGIEPEPVLSIDEAGGAHALWRGSVPGTLILRYAHRTGSGWPAPVTVTESWVHALSVDKPAVAWVAAGGDAVTALRASGSGFIAYPIDSANGEEVRIKVLDSGAVVVAWFGGDPLGLWVARS